MAAGVSVNPWLPFVGIPKDDQRLMRELDDARVLAACELGAGNRATIYLTVRTPRRCGHALQCPAYQRVPSGRGFANEG